MRRGFADQAGVDRFNITNRERLVEIKAGKSAAKKTGLDGVLQAVEEAMARLKKGGTGNKNRQRGAASVNPEDIRDLALVIAGHMARGAKTVASFAEIIKREYPHLYGAFLKDQDAIINLASRYHNTNIRLNPSESKKLVDPRQILSNKEGTEPPYKANEPSKVQPSPPKVAGQPNETPQSGVAGNNLEVLAGTANNQRPKKPGVNVPSFEPITQEIKEAPTPVEIPATNRGMLKFRIFGFLLLILAAVGAVIFVPIGKPQTYGRQSSPSFELIWMIQPGRVIDMGRVWTQTFILVAAAAACFYFSEKDKQS
jgi:hypothetical protein